MIMKDDITGLIITGIILLLILSLSGVLLSGHGAFLISGYNMLPKEKKEKYNEKELCRFTGSLLLVVALCIVLAIIAAMFELSWLVILITCLLIVISIGCIIYVNTNSRFKRK